MIILVAYRLTRRADRHVVVTLNYEDVLDYVDQPADYRVYAYELCPVTGRGIRRDLDPAGLQAAREKCERMAQERAARLKLEQEEQERWLQSDEYQAFRRSRAQQYRRRELEESIRSAEIGAEHAAQKVREAEGDLVREETYLAQGSTDAFFEEKAPATLRRVRFYEERLQILRKEHCEKIDAVSQLEEELACIERA